MPEPTTNTAPRRPSFDVDSVFTYHKPFGDQPARYEAIREQAREFATFILSATPQSREQSIALTSLQEVVMWANAAIANNEKESTES